MEDPTFFTQYQTMMNPIEYPFDADVDDINFQSESYSSYPNYINGSSSIHEAFHHQLDDLERVPLKQLKTNNNWNSCIIDNIPVPKASSSSSRIISFHNSNSTSPDVSQQYNGLDCDLKLKDEVTKRVSGSFAAVRSPLHAQEHVIAERKRREKITQAFLSLSALVPGLKKKDKNSVLGAAIEYLKQLQERMAKLEEQVAKKTVESVKIVKKTHFDADDHETSPSISTKNFDIQTNNPFPEIEARVSNKDVLIRIHCNTNKGCISNIINEIEKLHLSVINSNVLPFGQTTLDITIVAQMEAEFSMTLKDLVKTLRQCLLKLL